MYLAKLHLRAECHACDVAAGGGRPTCRRSLPLEKLIVGGEACSAGCGRRSWSQTGVK